MKSLLIVIKEEFLSKGIALALMNYFQSIHTTKNPYDAIKMVKEEKINVVITELRFETLDSDGYLEKLTNASPKGTSIIIIKDDTISLKDSANGINIIIQEKPISLQYIKTIIKSLEHNSKTSNKGEN